LAADCIRLKTIIRQAVRLPLPLVLRCRKRTMAIVLSIGLVVRICFQCSAGKSEKVNSSARSFDNHSHALEYFAP
jgi:hypothetical protein